MHHVTVIVLVIEDIVIWLFIVAIPAVVHVVVVVDFTVTVTSGIEPATHVVPDVFEY